MEWTKWATDSNEEDKPKQHVIIGYIPKIYIKLLIKWSLNYHINIWYDDMEKKITN